MDARAERPASSPVAATWAASVAWAVVVLAAAYGLLVRIWLLAHLPLFGDEAVVGLIGRGILSGHLTAFYWGQHYGGAEPYLVAAVLGPINGGPMGLNATAVVLSALAAVLVGVALAAGGARRSVAALGGALVWVWPYATGWNSVREIGFRGVALAAGVLLVLCATRVARGRTGHMTCLLLGGAAGVGWWASPEIVYFAVPVAVLLAPALIAAARRRRVQPFVRPAVETALAAVVGALPWLYANLRDGFASLTTGAPAPAGFGYLERLRIFFQQVLPTQLGLRGVPNGGWVGGAGTGRTLYVILLVVLAVLLARAAWSVRFGPSAAPLWAAAAGVAAFPFLYAVFPTSWFAADGRYGVFLPPLVVLAAGWSTVSHRVEVVTGDAPARARHRRVRAAPRATAVTMVTVAALLAGAASTVTVAHEAGGVPTSPSAFFTGWTDPNAAARHVAAALEAHHLRNAYGDYWTAYTLDFLAPQSLAVSPSPLDVQRSLPLAHHVARARRVAWLFAAPAQSKAAAIAFSNPESGPGDYSQATFIAYLRAHHDGFRIVPLGVLNAVVPVRPVHLHP